MVRPVIGITVGRFWDKEGRERVGCGPAYMRQVWDAGGAVVLVPPAGEAEAARALVARLDGLLASGGGDVHGSEFGQAHHPKAGESDRERDKLELEAIRLAARRGVPILGICRGIQMINVALGGDLIQDIASERSTDLRHDAKTRLAHTIEIDPRTVLASLLGAGTVEVNSRHHQAVGRVARGLIVTARAADGVIEAVEAADGRPILGVQFHPEDIVDEGKGFRAIFEWLVREARKSRGVKRKE